MIITDLEEEAFPDISVNKISTTGINYKLLTSKVLCAC